jgi:ceramide glucosyltransferase
MPGGLDAFFLGTVAMSALGLGYRAWASRCIARWLSQEVMREARGVGECPPISYLRPIKRGVPDLQEKIGMHVAALRNGDELILGFDADDAEQLALVDGLTGALTVVRCERREWENPKIAKLAQMTPLARHEHWIVCDSEMFFDVAFAEVFRDEWMASGADALTAPYRFAGAHAWPQWLDAVAVLVTLWPGLAVLRKAGRIAFALGACTALRRSRIESIGGWARFADELAEDHRLGVEIVRDGGSVRLSRAIATLGGDDLSWRSYWRHQCRVAVTYRVCNPLGFAGQIVTHSFSWALLAVLLGASRLPVAALAWLIGVWIALVWVAQRDADRIGFPSQKLWLAVPVASLVETSCWLLSWMAKRVWWGGRWRPISKRGKLLASRAR